MQKKLEKNKDKTVNKNIILVFLVNIENRQLSYLLGIRNLGAVLFTTFLFIVYLFSLPAEKVRCISKPDLFTFI